MEQLTNCPICNHNEFVPFLSVRDFTVSNEVFSIIQCKACGFKFTNPRPAFDEIGKYYESEDYISHSNTQKGIISFLYHQVRKRTLLQKSKLIESVTGKSKAELLDVGCGTGEFLAFMSGRGWKVTGIEPSEKARNFAVTHHKLNVFPPETFFTLPERSFSAITLWHVLEHVHSLNEYIIQVKKLLKSDGVLIIAVPNSEAADAAYYGAYWAAYDVPRHLYHFDQKAIEQLFLKHQVKLVDTYRMPFDAFYVSMLSERYKKSSFGLLKAFFQGFRSNLIAQNNLNACSSIIYVFKPM